MPPFFLHEQLMAGGELTFEMTDEPANAFLHFPHYRLVDNYPMVPLVKGKRVFKDKTMITLKAVSPNTRITYTTENPGEEFARKTQAYTGPFTISDTTNVIAYVTDVKTGAESMKVEAVFSKRANDWTVKLISEFNSQYPGSSYDAIIDGLRGNENFAAGEWQGFWGKPFEALIDLQRETEIRSVGGSFLQSTRSWIWMPSNIKFEISNNGSDWKEIAEIKTDIPLTEMKPIVKEFRRTILPLKVRYVRVRAANIGKIPTWHPGAGRDPWIFVDEVFLGT